MPEVLVNTSERGANNRGAQVAHVEGLGDVRRAEIDDDGLAGGLGRAEGSPSRVDALDHAACECCALKTEIHEGADGRSTLDLLVRLDGGSEFGRHLRRWRASMLGQRKTRQGSIAMGSIPGGLEHEGAGNVIGELAQRFSQLVLEV